MLFVAYQNLKYILYFINMLVLFIKALKLVKEISLFKNHTSKLICCTHQGFDNFTERLLFNKVKTIKP